MISSNLIEKPPGGGAMVQSPGIGHRLGRSQDVSVAVYRCIGHVLADTQNKMIKIFKNY